MFEAEKNERAQALKEAKSHCKEFGFSARVLKVASAENRKIK